VSAGKRVTFATNTNFSNLPTTTQTTDPGGQFTVNGLTSLVSGNQTLSATVEGQAVKVTVHVASNPYTLDMNPATLVQNTPTSVTFTLKLGGSAVGTGKSVIFAANTNFSNLPTAAQTTNAGGQFPVTNLTALSYGIQAIQATVDNQVVAISVNVTEAGFELKAGGVSGGGAFTAATTATITVQLQHDRNPYTTATPVTWSIVSAANNGPVASGYNTAKTGLAWGSSAAVSPESELTSTTTSNTSTSDGTASILLTDVMGQRTVAVQATVTIAATDYTVVQNVAFGNGPLAAFTGPPRASAVVWLDAVTLCGGDRNTVNVTIPEYSNGSYLPDVDVLQKVAERSGKGAAYAAGWNTGIYYWTGRIAKAGYADTVNPSSGMQYTQGIASPPYRGAVCVPNSP
jgi:hypothetical protein